MDKLDIVIERKAGRSDGELVLLPKDCSGVVIGLDLDPLDAAFGKAVVVSLERWIDGKLNRTFRATLHSDYPEPPSLLVIGPWGGTEVRAGIESKDDAALPVGAKATAESIYPDLKVVVALPSSIAVVQVDGDEITVTGGTSGNLTIAGVASGNALVCVIGSGGTPTLTTSDDKGNTWANAAINSSTVTSKTDVANNVASGDTVVTVTASVASNYNARVFEVSGQNTSTLVGATGTNNNTTTTTHHSAASGSIDAAGPCLVIVNCRTNSAYGTLTPGGSYTQITSGSALNMWQYRIFSSPPTDERGTFTSGNSVSSRGCIAELKEAAGGDELMQSRISIAVP